MKSWKEWWPRQFWLTIETTHRTVGIIYLSMSLKVLTSPQDLPYVESNVKSLHYSSMSVCWYTPWTWQEISWQKYDVNSWTLDKHVAAKKDGWATPKMAIRDGLCQPVTSGNWQATYGRNMDKWWSTNHQQFESYGKIWNTLLTPNLNPAPTLHKTAKEHTFFLNLVTEVY